MDYYVDKILNGSLKGADLASLQHNGTISKSERRSIMKAVQKKQKGSITQPQEPSSCSKDACEKKRKLNLAQDEDTYIPDSTQKEAMTAKQKKNAIKLLNKDLNSCAMKKQLQEAINKVRASAKKGLSLDVHSYTNLINCHARCGDVEGAMKTFHMMKENGVKPNIVTLTALLRGCCDSGDVSTARDIFLREMIQRIDSAPSDKKKKKKNDGAHIGFTPDPSLFPNQRALATLLRGCQRLGNVGLAEEAFSAWNAIRGMLEEEKKEDEGLQEHENKRNEEEDEATTTTASLLLVSIMCQTLRVERACEVAETMMKQEGAGADLDRSFAAWYIARAYAVQGELRRAKAWTELARGLLAKTKSSGLLRAMQRHSTVPVLVKGKKVKT